jgi:hypothetical protein
MKRQVPATSARRIIRRISDLRELSRRLAEAGFQAGLHKHDPNRLPHENKVAEDMGTYTTRARRK